MVEGQTVETDLNVVHGSLPQYDGETPTKAGNAQYSYVFTGWDKTIPSKMSAQNTTINATWQINQYTLKIV